MFGDNRSKPFHRWFPFVEGYSADLVDRALEAAPSARVVFDPFGGSGTTALAAAMRGLDSCFTEVNPYMAWVADVKVNQAAALARTPRNVHLLTSLSKDLESRILPKAPTDHPLLAADRVRGFFPKGVATQILGLLRLIDDEYEGPTREVARLAVASAIIPSSSMLRRTDLRRRTPRDPAPTELIPRVGKSLGEFAADVLAFGQDIRGRTVQIGADVRENWTPERPIDLMVTSPPYLNGTNYCRNSKLELLALGLIESEANLRSLRSSAITAGINNVTASKAASERPPSVEEVAKKLDALAYDRRIPALVRSYFTDMTAGLARMRANCAPGTRLLLDIGDSKYAGVHVPTDDLLADCAERVGWKAGNTEVLRTRRSYDGSSLSQVLMHFEAVA